MPDIRDLLDAPLREGDLVIDREDLRESSSQDSYQPLYVMRVTDTQANDRLLPDVGDSVAQLNPDYDGQSHVIRVAYEGGLDDAYGTTWREHIFDGLAEWVWEQHRRSGRLPQLYDFPEDRLVPATIEVNIVPGENPTQDEVDKLARRIKRFVGSFGEDVHA